VVGGEDPAEEAVAGGCEKTPVDGGGIVCCHGYL
jgi:hypothetical protein